MLLYELVHPAHLVAHIHKGFFDHLLEHPGGKQQNGNGCKHQQRQLPIHPEHRTNDHNQGQDIPYRIEDAIGKHIRNPIDVTHVARHQGADRCAIEIAQLKLGDMPKQLGTQVQTNRLGHPIRQVSHPVLKQRFKNEHATYREKDLQQQFGVSRGHGVINGNAYQRRSHPNQTTQCHHEHTGREESPPIRLHLRQNLPQRRPVKNSSGDFAFGCLAHVFRAS